MTSPRYNGPAASRRDSAAIQAGAGGSSLGGLVGQTAGIDLGGSAGAFGTRDDRLSRPSLDNMGSASGSRRPSAQSQSSQASMQSTSPHLASHPPQSPAVSVSSSSTHPWMTPRDYSDPSGSSNQFSTSPQAFMSQLPQHQQLPSPMDAPRKHHNLPRIATPPTSSSSSQRSARSPSTDDMEYGGPRSAPPVSSPLAGPAMPFAAAPLRSASDPSRADGQGSGRSSPMTSPVSPDPRAAHIKSRSQDGAGVPPRVAPAFPNAAAATDYVGRRSDTPTSTMSSQAAVPMQSQLSAPSSSSKRTGATTYCAKCGLTVHGQFVRALHQVYHLECFRCKDCDKVVAQKFFPIEDSEGGQYPLCERDYFARLGLICSKCDQALRSSYITACGEKFHVEHFSCSVCDTVFGANDSYYEHGGKAYCHYHYSISFANKCVGCETAILKQFVEINRNGKDECWHPECYLIHKFWNVRLASRNFSTPANSTPVTSSLSLMEMSSTTGPGGIQPMTSSTPPPTTDSPSPGWGNDMTAEELKERQIAMELKVSQIWLVLSGFEESSAACIGEMLRVVNERKLLDVILVAEKLILHVETLFAVIDDLEAQFVRVGAKGMSHSREAKHLCRKLVNFFQILSQITPHSFPDMKTLLLQVTQLAHYLKITIRIALTGAIKLDREQANPQAMTNALARLHLLSLDGADPSLQKRGDHPAPTRPLDPWTGNESPEEMAKRSFDSLTRRPEGFTPSTQQIAYGYRSLAYEATGETTLRGPQDDDFVATDGCARCNGNIEDDCIRLGMFNRWHSECVECRSCGDNAGNVNILNSPIGERRAADEDSQEGSTAHAPEPPSRYHNQRRPPPRVDDFLFEPTKQQFAPADIIWCNLHRSATAIHGFESVSRLEQFAFLLHVALRGLYLHFREHHKIPSGKYHHSANTHEGHMLTSPAVLSRPESHDVKRVKSVMLDRKLSSTARLPQRSTVIDSPAGRTTDENGQVVPAAREPTAPIIMTPTASDQSATVDVIRPPFARNNTSVRIVSQAASEAHGTVTPPDNDVLSPLMPGGRAKEADAITLNDIPMLAARRHKSPLDNLPLISELSSLQAMIIRHFALLHLQKTGLGHLVEPDDLMDLLDARKNQWWNKLFKNNAKKEQKRKGIFGVPIEILVDRTGSDSQQGISPRVNLRVPEFIEEITSTMRQQDMAVEGIFRKNGNIRRLQKMTEELDTNYSAVNLSEDNPVQLAALLKKFLREIPDPLLTFRLHKLWCAAASMPNPEDRARCLHLLMMLLPKPNRDTIEVLFVFLRWVASFSGQNEESGSKMDLPNIATVITPNILYGRGATAAREESFIAITAVQTLLEKQDDFYRVPPELMYLLRENVANLFNRDVDMPPKEIHKLCTKYLNKRGGGGWARPSGSGSGTGSQSSLHAGMTPKEYPPSGAMSQRPSYSAAPGQSSLPGQREGGGRLSSVPPPPHREDMLRSASVSEESNTTLRATPSPINPGGGSRPTSWAAPVTGTAAIGTPGTSTPTGTINTAPSVGQHEYNSQNPPTGLAMPMPQPVINGNPAVISPGGSYSHAQMPIPSPGWRGPFQGPASNGSRQSSRGSAPPSPGVGGDERRSFQMDRDRSRDRQ